MRALIEFPWLVYKNDEPALVQLCHKYRALPQVSGFDFECRCETWGSKLAPFTESSDSRRSPRSRSLRSHYRPHTCNERDSSRLSENARSEPARKQSTEPTALGASKNDCVEIEASPALRPEWNSCLEKTVNLSFKGFNDLKRRWADCLAFLVNDPIRPSLLLATLRFKDLASQNPKSSLAKVLVTSREKQESSWFLSLERYPELKNVFENGKPVFISDITRSKSSNPGPAPGEAPLSQGAGLLLEASNLKTRLQEINREPHGTLRVGAPQSLWLDALWKSLARAETELPQVRVHIRVGAAAPIKDSVTKGELELGIVLDDKALGDFDSEVLRRGKFVIVSAPAFRESLRSRGFMVTGGEKPEVRSPLAAHPTHLHVSQEGVASRNSRWRDWDTE